MIEHMFCSCQPRGPGSRPVISRKSGSAARNISDGPGVIDAGQIGCVPGGSRPLLAATDPSVGPPTRPAARARAQEPTRPRRQRATGPRSLVATRLGSTIVASRPGGGHARQSWPRGRGIGRELANINPRSARPRLTPILRPFGGRGPRFVHELARGPSHQGPNRPNFPTTTTWVDIRQIRGAGRVDLARRIGRGCRVQYGHESTAA
jgi:hypothetical protein